MMVVWDSITGTPLRTYLNPHPGGIRALDISSDCQYLVTLGADSPQTVSLWEWLNTEQEGPINSKEFIGESFKGNSPMHWCAFNPDTATEFVTMNKKTVFFFNWEEQTNELHFYFPKVNASDFSKPERFQDDYTKTVFIPGQEMAVTGTEKGDILVWYRSLIMDGIGEQHEKKLIKVVTLNHEAKLSGINILTTHDRYLVVGNQNGTIRFYDFHFKIVAWFEELELNTIKSISFSNVPPRAATDFPSDDADDSFKCADFVIADSSAMVVRLQSSLFEEIDSEKRKGKLIFHGLKSKIAAVAIHPHEPILAIAGEEGFILLWDY